MSNEEAIKILSHTSNLGYGVVIEPVEGYTTRDIKIALDMAIESLGVRPQGEWLPLSDISSSGFGTWVCSQCCQGFRGIKSKMPYCTCGAKMSNGGTDMRGEE